jgi:hypothetical protein
MDNQEVTVEPLPPDKGRRPSKSCGDPSIGDIVLVTVNGRQYLHQITDVDTTLNAPWVTYYQIGNNRGGINGKVKRDAIHGRMIHQTCEVHP